MDDLIIVPRCGEHSHVVAIENIDEALFAGSDEFMNIRTVLIGKNENSRRTQVQIVSIEEGNVPGSEVIAHREIGGIELQHAVAVGLAALRNVVATGAGFGRLYKDVVVLVGGEPVASLPDRGQPVIRRSVEDGGLRQAGFIVGQYPTAVVVVAGVGSEADIDGAIQQQQSGTV